MNIKAKFENFDDLLNHPDYISVANVWKEILKEYSNSPLPSVWPIEDGGYSLNWADGINTLTIDIGSDDDGWFWRNHITKEYGGSEDNSIDINAIAKFLKETDWKF